MNAKLVLCLSIVGILSPSALAIIAGFNADIHMDIRSEEHTSELSHH
jgi:hypothetical protein